MALNNLLGTFMAHSPLMKVSLPFLLAMMSLFSYSMLDRLLPNGYTYGSIEYAGSVSAMNDVLILLDTRSAAVLGLSIGLHFLNTVLYTACLAFACSWIALQLSKVNRQLNDKHKGLLMWGHIFTRLQLLLFMVYAVQHTLIAVVVLNNNAYASLPQAIMALSILFLIILVTTVIYIVVATIVIYRHRRAHSSQSTSDQVSGQQEHATIQVIEA